MEGTLETRRLMAKAIHSTGSVVPSALMGCLCLQHVHNIWLPVALLAGHVDQGCCTLAGTYVMHR